MQYMTFESTTISSCSFFPLESEVKYLALLPHLRIILVHPDLELHSYWRYSAILGFVILEWNKFHKVAGNSFPSLFSVYSVLS